MNALTHRTNLNANRAWVRVASNLTFDQAVMISKRFPKYNAVGRENPRARKAPARYNVMVPVGSIDEVTGCRVAADGKLESFL